MRILLFGKNGQVGSELHRTLAPLGEVVAVDFPEVDFLDLEALSKFIISTGPDLIVNAAAYTAVDQAESEPDLAMMINGKAPGVIAEVARDMNIGLVHYSTDYVFDGTKGEPYTEDDPTNPINVYGHSKLMGDQLVQQSGCAHIIIRTSWVYGIRGKNFFLTILRLAREQDTLYVVDDQIGCPTWSRFIAEFTANVLAKISKRTNDNIVRKIEDITGVYNYSASTSTSWHGFAKGIIECAADSSKRENRIVPIGSDESSSIAQRPKYSVLSIKKASRLLQTSPEPWDFQLQQCWNTYEHAR